MGFLGVCFAVVGVKLPPVWNSLELSQKLESWYVSTHTYAVSGNILFSTKTSLILLMPALSLEKISIFSQNSISTQSNSVTAAFRYFLVLFSIFVRENFTTIENLSLTDLLQIDHKSKKITMTSQFFEITSSSNFFEVVFFHLSSLVTGPRFISISSLVLELWQFSFIRD